MESWKFKTRGSERAFNSIQSDQGIMSDDTNQVLETTYSEVISEIENEQDTSHQNSVTDRPFAVLNDCPGQQVAAEVEVGTPANQKSNKKLHWTEEPTKLLLRLLIEARPKLGKYAAIRNKTKMWNFVANEMKKRGYMFSAVQVENKFRTFERQYKKDKQRGKNSIYQSDLEEIFEPKKAGNSRGKRTFKEEPNSDVNSDMEPNKAENTIDRRTARKHRALQREMQNTLARIAKERKQYHDKVLYYLNKKEERERRREERAEKKLKLLELFIKQL